MIICIALWCATLLWSNAAHAQTVEATHAITGATDTLVQYGIGGVFLLFLIGLGWFLWSALQTAQSDNRALTREAIAGLNTSAAAIKDLTAGLKGLDDRAENRHAAVDSLPDQVREVGDIGKRNTGLLENNREAIARIEDAINDRPPRRRAGT